MASFSQPSCLETVKSSELRRPYDEEDTHVHNSRKHKVGVDRDMAFNFQDLFAGYGRRFLRSLVTAQPKVILRLSCQLELNICKNALSAHLAHHELLNKFCASHRCLRACANAFACGVQPRYVPEAVDDRCIAFVGIYNCRGKMHAKQSELFAWVPC